MVAYNDIKKKFSKMPEEKKLQIRLTLFRKLFKNWLNDQIKFEKNSNKPDYKIIDYYEKVLGKVEDIPIQILPRKSIEERIIRDKDGFYKVEIAGENIKLGNESIAIRMPVSNNTLRFEPAKLAHELAHIGTSSEIAADVVAARFMTHFMQPYEIREELYKARTERAGVFREPEKYIRTLEVAIRHEQKQMSRRGIALPRGPRTRVRRSFIEGILKPIINLAKPKNIIKRPINRL